MIYTYLPENTNSTEFVLDRNVELAKVLADIVGTDYAGILKQTKLPPNSVLLPHTHISPEEAKRLNITNTNQIFGAVSPDLHSMKTILHKLVPNPKTVPNNFPHKFVENLDKNIIAPGYAVFSMEDALKAYELLTKQGYSVRLKDPECSFGMNQHVLHGTEQLESLINKKNKQAFKEFGVVLEANIHTTTISDQEPQAYSGGQTSIKDKKYSYVGIQTIKDTQTIHRYLGTKIFLIEGDFAKLKAYLENPVLKEIAAHLENTVSLMKHLPDVTCSRLNFDFVYGMPQKNPVVQTHPARPFLTDQSFRVGGATIAELLAIRDLQMDSSKKLVVAESKINYGVEQKNQIPQHAHIFYRKIDPDLGHMQVWGVSHR